MNSAVKKVVGATALGALSIVEMLQIQQASATPVTFTGSTNSNPHGGSMALLGGRLKSELQVCV